MIDTNKNKSPLPVNDVRCETIDDFERELSKKYKISSELTPRGYIFPDGKNLALDSQRSHAQVLNWLIDKGCVEEYDGIYDGGCPPIEDLGCIRTNLDTEGFIMLSVIEPTEAQYDALLKLIDEFAWRRNMWKYSSDLMILEPHQKSDFKSFSVVNNLSDDIVNIIRNYYRIGRLTESKKKQKLSNIEALTELSWDDDNSDVIKEEYVDEDRFVYTSESAYEVVSRMKSSTESLRILWDRHLDRFFVCYADELIHGDMVDKAVDAGYYGEQFESRYEISSYLDEFGKNVIYYIYAPKGKEKETYGSDVSEDGYEGKYVYDFGTVTTRSDDKYKSSPLAKALGKYKEHYVQDGWIDEYRPKVRLVAGLEDDSKGKEVDSQGNELSAEQSEFFKHSVVRDKNNRLLVVYHGTSRKFDDETFKSPINWFSTSLDYAKQFGTWTKQEGYNYLCYLNCVKLFDCGATDGPIFNPMTLTQPYAFSERFKDIFNKLGVDEKTIRKIISEVAVEYDEKYDGYKMKIHVLTRSTKFKDILVKRGYDGIKCVENRVETFGVFNANAVKSIDNKAPTMYNNIRQ